MNQQEPILNRVANSALVSIDLETFYPEGERVLLDIQEVLYMGLMLREKEFRQWVKEHDWSQYTGKHVAIHCSADAIVPVWAYMLIATRLEPYTSSFVYGDLTSLEDQLFTMALQKLDPQQYAGAKVVIKGCSNKPVPVAAYVALTRMLRPHVSSIMYGEPCSTVPLYKAGR
ncbi:DUF2480 family protein [Cesiribacter andamanensis]|uniref:DUF2480 family protein n=1 Tax=Cesiribacter andamanensis AMV16 TaxID=1279009 RepID=M7MY41_9BACT|nr:DUF2480 family protein [Cesiribacter andamanensis]EMR01353.1 hypothetical protein ADICEAN_03510 [Cesiribacter andamanensis AMV16]